MSDSPSKPSSGALPLLERLRERFGSEVDPGITLQHERTARPATRSPGPSSGPVELRSPLATRYRVEGEIACGGMGVILEVWDADLRRHLAMKVALDGHRAEGSAPAEALDPRILARFLEEAQVTGQLDHPGIVPVHELGLDANGHLYFTMRRVRGRDLEHVFELARDEREGWSLTRALGVLLKACEALAFAHEKGVIHRDLKPANVMVGSFGEVYVMDWGLARVLGTEAPTSASAPPVRARVATDRREDASGASAEELYTLEGDVLGTPAYMAPEQARGELDLLDARSDVYAMGAMLYHLCAGTRPFVAPEERVGALEVLRRARSGPPERLERLAPRVPAELVAICERAMERDPARRYPGMLALAEDLRAYLEHRVVRAYESGAFAEARKWVRRNRPLAISLAAGVLALVVGLVASWFLKSRADANARLAEDRRVAADASAAEARRQARISEEVNEFLNVDLLAAVAPEREGRDVGVKQVLDAAAERLEGRFPDEPRIEAELRRTIGTSYERLGEYERAREQLERGRELALAAVGASDPWTIDLEGGLAQVWLKLGRGSDAYELESNVLERARAVFGAEAPETLSCENDLALVCSVLRRIDEARSLYESALEGQRRALGDEHPETITARNNLGVLEMRAGRFERAYELLAVVVEQRRRVLGAHQRGTMEALQNLALVCSELRRFDESERLLLEALEIAGERLGPEHPDTGRALSTLGALYFQQGRGAEAERTLRRAEAVLRTSLGDENPETLLVQNSLAVLLAEGGRIDEAEPLREAILESQRRVLGPEHSDTLDSQNALALILAARGRYDEAERLLRATIEARTRTVGPDHPRTIAEIENLGNVLYGRGDREGAREIVLQVLEARERVLGPEHPDTARTMVNLALLEKQLGNPDGARTLLEDALERSRAAFGESHPAVAVAERRLADLRLEAGEFAGAAELYLRAADVRRALTPDDPELGLCLHQAAFARARGGELDEAIELALDAVETRRRALGASHASTLVSLRLLVTFLVDAKRYDEAESNGLELHDRALESEGRDADTTRAARALLGRIYDALGRPEEAARWR